MKRILFLAVVFLAVKSQELTAWSELQHSAINYIADCHLNAKAKKRIERYLGGRSIVYYASWMDHIRKTPEYIFSDTWHMDLVDENFKRIDNERYGGVPALEEVIKKLKNYKSLDDSTVAVNIKFLIHLLPDLHTPCHVAYTNRRSFNVKYNGVERSYHAVWDGLMLNNANPWSYTEYQRELDRFSANEKKQVTQGTPREWFEQTARDCAIIYDWAKPGDELGVDFMVKAHALGERQMLIAGYRLAYVLNQLFG